MGGVHRCGAGSVEWPLASKVEGFLVILVDKPWCRGPTDQLPIEPWLLLPHALSKDLLGRSLRSTIIQHFWPIYPMMTTGVPEFCAGDAAAKATSVPLCLTRSEKTQHTMIPRCGRWNLDMLELLSLVARGLSDRPIAAARGTAFCRYEKG